MPPRDTVRAWLAQAARAPSSHNTQPWRFVAAGDRVDLWADRSRALPVNDPEDRELTISCGAVLRGLEIAAAAGGHGTRVELLPVADDPDHLARIAFTATPDPIDAGLAAHLGARRSTREPFLARAVPAGLAAELRELVGRHPGVVLRIVDDPAVREHVATLVEAGDRRQFADPRWRRELAQWMRARRAGDGLAVPAFVGPALRAVIRSLDLGRSTGRADRQLVRDAPLLAVLGSESDEPRAWLETGRALHTVLLGAASRGVQAGYANQPCQVAELRPELRAALAIDAAPQVVLRFGHAAPAERPSARRPIDDLVEPAATAAPAR